MCGFQMRGCGSMCKFQMCKCANEDKCADFRSADVQMRVDVWICKF
jgi:hypothetical protein